MKLRFAVIAAAFALAAIPVLASEAAFDRTLQVNGKVRDRTGFDDVFVQPAAGDAGTALGAAQYVWHQVLGRPRGFVMTHAYFADIDIPMKPDGTLAGLPVIQGAIGPQSGVAKAMADNAVRAIIQCAPYTSLPREQYASWKLIESRFGLKQFQ